MLPIQDSNTSNTKPLITWLVIFITSVIFIVEFCAPDLTIFLTKWSLIPSHISFTHFQTLYPFITSIFLHGGFMHIISNMWFLRIYGDNVENDMGPLLFILFYIAAGIVGNGVQYLFAMNSSVFHLGASGAIAGVMGYYLIRFPHNTVTCLFPSIYLHTFDLPAQIVLGLWIITQFFNGAGSLAVSPAHTGIAWWAHVGGALFGVCIGYLFLKFKTKTHEL